MKNENYIQIQGWMINELKLSGNELICYAIIYGFSQDGETKYNGSSSYLSKCMNCSKPTVFKTLKSLIEKGVLIKTDIYNNGVKFCQYSTIFIGSKESLSGVVKKLNRGGKESLSGGSKETLHNNTITNNTIDNTNNIIPEKSFDYKSINGLNVEYWEKWRAFKKEQFNFSYKPIGEKTAITELLKTTDNNTSKQKDIIIQSIKNGYRGLFDLKDSLNKRNEPKKVNDGSDYLEIINKIRNND